MILPLLWCLTTASPAATHALTVGDEVHLEDLVAETKAVVRATVVGTHTRARGTGLRTTYTLVVTATLHGQPLDELQVVLPGGRTEDGLQERVHGVPLWTEGDEVVVAVPWQGQPSLRGVWTLHEDEHFVHDPHAIGVADLPEDFDGLVDALHALRHRR